MRGKNPVNVLLTSTFFLMAVQVRANEQQQEIAPFLVPPIRLIVFSPHPDDETLGAGGLIQRVLRLGGAVKVVFLTSGDGFPDGVRLAKHISFPTAQDYQEYGLRRQREAVTVLATLGVRGKDITFLGFPDAGLYAILSHYQDDNGSPYRSPFTLADRPPGADRLLLNTAYTGEDLKRELRHILADFVPTLVVLPHPQDQHPDHCATYFFVTDAIKELEWGGSQIPRVFTFLIHWGQWPLDVGSGGQLTPPRGFPESRWVPLPLTAAEVETKRQALLQYQTQLLVMGNYLLSFARAEELFFLTPRTNASLAAKQWCCRNQQ